MMCFSCRVTSDAKVVFLDVIPTPQDIISDFHYFLLHLRRERIRYSPSSLRFREMVIFSNATFKNIKFCLSR